MEYNNTFTFFFSSESAVENNFYFMFESSDMVFWAYCKPLTQYLWLGAFYLKRLTEIEANSARVKKTICINYNEQVNDTQLNDF